MVGFRTSWQAARDAVRTELWPLPTAAIVVAIAAGIVLPKLETHLDGSLPAWTGQYLFGGDADAARTVLDAVASSLITVTSLTFSLTVVTLQLASSQFSPRLLRTFTRDLFVQATLGLFLATFAFALTVLRSVRTAGDGQTLFVPRLAVTIGYVLAVASVLGLVLFLAHLAQQIRVETMLRNVHNDAADTAQQVLDEAVGEHHANAPEVPADAMKVLAAESGFLVQVDTDSLLEAAVRFGVVILVDRLPGASIVVGTPAAFAWSTSAQLSPDRLADLRRCIEQALMVGFERNSVQDIGFGLRQLTDVATKALSPGINDPTTAVHALGHSAALLCALAGRELGTVVRADDHGTVRVVLRRPDLAGLLELAVAQPRRYGAGDPAVLTRLYELLRELAWCAPAGSRPVIADQLTRLTGTAVAQDFDPSERAELAVRHDLVEDALHGRWPAAPG